MAASRIAQALVGHRLIGLDSCVLIYHLEGHDEFGGPAREVLDHVEPGRCRGVLSTLALLELQVGPYRSHAEDLASRYYGRLLQLANVSWVPVTYPLADRAAQIRAEHNTPAPDAIHLATALMTGAALFVTNDRSLPELPGLDYLQLGE